MRRYERRTTRVDEAILGVYLRASCWTSRTLAAFIASKKFTPLAGQLPKDYSRFDNDVLESMMRTFDNDVLRTAAGDVFGRIYEYFLAEFSKQGRARQRRVLHAAVHRPDPMRGRAPGHVSIQSMPLRNHGASCDCTGRRASRGPDDARRPALLAVNGACARALAPSYAGLSGRHDPWRPDPGAPRV